MSRLSALKVLLAKIEATYGQDANPTGAANGMLVEELKVMPFEGKDVELAYETGWLGANPTVPADRHRKITFKVPLTGSGAAGTPPPWGVFLRGCGVAETIVANTSVTYNPVSGGHEALTFYHHRDGSLYPLLGSRGTAKLAFPAGDVPRWEFEFTGLYVEPSDVAMPTPDLSAFQKPREVSPQNTPTLTFGGTPMAARSLELDFGNKIELRKLIGEDGVEIVDRADKLSTQITARDLATYNPFAAADGATEAAIGLVHDTRAGHIATLAIPRAQAQRPSLTEAQGKDEWPMPFVALPIAGNDQWTLTLT